MGLPVQTKLTRLYQGEAPRVLDLFSGCGGISLGFKRAKCEILGGLEIDPDAAQVFARNLLGWSDSDLVTRTCERDIVKTDPRDLVRDLGEEDPELAVDFLVGGPPCQAFARIGRAKLRAERKKLEEEDPDRQIEDARVGLYAQYLRYVKALKPVALFMENVPEVIRFQGRNIAEEIAEALEALDYRVSYSLLNAADYGVPQRRIRLCLLAWHKDFREDPPSLPPPSHHDRDLPDGYYAILGGRTRQAPSGRQAKLKLVPGAATFGGRRYHRPPRNEAAPRPVSVHDAIGDLPTSTAHHAEDPLLPDYLAKAAGPAWKVTAPSAYGRDMRAGWLGGSNASRVADHKYRHTKRDYRIFCQMKPGDEYPRAHAIAVALHDERLQRREQELGCPLAEDSDEHKKLLKDWVPPYPHDRFPNKWWKMDADQPSRTLTAHLSHDTYSHIHPDSKQARMITVREAARLQSFPDDFVFTKTMNPAFRMIGNAVPPLLAFAVADHLVGQIRAMASQEGTVEEMALIASK